MKALILSGGFGTRLRPLTYSQQKQLIPIANKPILFYAIEDCISAGADEIGIIVGPNKEQVKETVESVDWPVPIKFIPQDYPKGLAHTILVAEEFLKDDPFIMYLGDNILNDDIKKHSKMFTEGGFDSYVLLCEVPNPREFGVVEVNDKGEIIHLVEKPKEPKTNLVIIGIYFFTSPIIQGAKSIKPSWRDQLEIVDAIQWMIDKGYKIGYATVTGYWKDTGKPEDILDANRLVLDEIDNEINGELINTTTSGRVKIGEGSKIENSTIKGPAIIGKNCQIKDSYIGPNSSIGDESSIINTEIEDSVILDHVEIINATRVVESLIGRNAKIIGIDKLPQGHRFVIGDGSEVRI
jgi:glucose-1-phosphate thymidylyltransferase